MPRPFPAVDELAQALQDEPPPLVGAELEAAVLVCLCAGALLLIRRQQREEDRWSGHVALPGGRHDQADATLLDTALRETHEELGFAVHEHGRVLGTAGVLTGRSLGVRVAIFVAHLLRQPSLVLSEEVTAAYWVPSDALVTSTARVPELTEPVPCYRVEADGNELVVWGLTYRILERLRGAG
jgi:8-oxo-dGTP pyrophosphatase MutT (NUDIX family)